MAYQVFESNNLFPNRDEMKLQIAYELAGIHHWLISRSIKKNKEHLLQYIHKKPREIAEIILSRNLAIKEGK